MQEGGEIPERQAMERKEPPGHVLPRQLRDLPIDCMARLFEAARWRSLAHPEVAKARCVCRRWRDDLPVIVAQCLVREISYLCKDFSVEEEEEQEHEQEHEHEHEHEEGDEQEQTEGELEAALIFVGVGHEKAVAIARGDVVHLWQAPVQLSSDLQALLGSGINTRVYRFTVDGLRLTVDGLGTAITLGRRHRRVRDLGRVRGRALGLG